MVDLLDSEWEVDVETERLSGESRRTTIWVVVDEGEVFIRSWLGERGRWYRDALRSPGRLTLRVAGQRVPVTARHVDDPALIERCSRALARKYRGDPSTPAMLAPEVLGSTLLLERRTE